MRLCMPCQTFAFQSLLSRLILTLAGLIPIVASSLAVAADEPDVATLTAKLEQLGAKVTAVEGAITQVQVTADTFTEADYRTLAACRSLQRLTISGKTLNDTTLPLLASLTELEELSTNVTMLSDDGYRHFKPFKKLKRLALFHPSWAMADFTGRGLAELKELPALERLTYAGATTGDEAMQAIGQLTQLREFRTWHTMQTQTGNEHLLQLTQLTALRIGQRLPRSGKPAAASFDDSTIPLLAKLKALERLELSEARLSGEALAKLRELPQLKQLLIETTDISAVEVEELRSTLPQVKITFKPLSDEEKQELLVKKLKL